MALRIFQQELQTLYRRSMLAAGFDQDETSEQSKKFKCFAFHAWKEECERLQKILGGVDVNTFLQG
jgi:hypothetical protein